MFWILPLIAWNHNIEERQKTDNIQFKRFTSGSSSI